jgi:carbonic anhydrase
MRLFEAIIDANHRAAAGEKSAGLHPSEFADSLPVVALTCIDPRLNALMPEVLGIEEKDFIWLRNAGNIIFDPMSSMMRTLALACAVKGGKEIAIIGHTDCKVGKMSMVELTDRFKALGLDRSKLPENLNEFFGLFASERQNVIHGAEFVRKSPLIGPRIPVHGLVVDIASGKLEWIVNGYQSLGTSAASVPHLEVKIGDKELLDVELKLPSFQIGEMKFPEFKIGEAISAAIPSIGKTEAAAAIGTAAGQIAPTIAPLTLLKMEEADSPVSGLRFDRAAMFKIMGADTKIYGPVTGKEIETWVSEGRIDGTTLAQRVGYKDWKPLASFAQTAEPPKIPIPRAIPLPRHGSGGKKF